MRVKPRSVILGLVTLGVILAGWTCAEANRRVERRMTWHYGEPAPQWPSAKHIVLTFVDYPHEFVGVYSPDLGPYLESLRSRQVQVVFEISPVYGGMHGIDWINPVKLLDLGVGRVRGTVWYNAVQVGDLTRWRSDFSYGGRKGIGRGSPWD